MLFRIFLFTGTLIFSFINLTAQPITEISDKTIGEDTLISRLEFWEDSLTTFSNNIQKKVTENERLEACYNMIPVLVQALKEDDSFRYPFDDLEFISTVYAPDSTFRLLTWLVRLDDIGYRYFGSLQMNNENKDLFPLFHQLEPVENIMKATLNFNQWYGAIYYNITKVSHQQQEYYMLFGWDGNDMLSQKKVLDVLHFDKDKPVLGAPIVEFETPIQEGTFSRMFLEYNKEATVNLNYDTDLKMIVFDHIAPEDGKSFGMYPTYIPDGTYEALKFTNGKWQYVDKVFHQTQDEAPIPAPLFKDKGPLPVELPKNE